MVMEEVPELDRSSLPKIHLDASRSKFKTHFPTEIFFNVIRVPDKSFNTRKGRGMFFAVVQRKMLQGRERFVFQRESFWLRKSSVKSSRMR